jgi:CheY-like chemotaxis protein
LVIDDNANNRMIMEHTLNNWGIEFYGVENGPSALNLIAKSKPFDVIIVDYHMPDMNGLMTISLIREELHLSPEIQPVILLHSSSDDVAIYEECRKLGVIFNLTKPVKSSELMQYLNRIPNQQTSSVTDPDQGLYSESVALINNSTPVILVAEDVIINMILITTLIKQMIPNVIVIEAKNGEEAFEMTISKKPDLIIMDIQMPVMSGIEATLAIRYHERGSDRRIPIIALTAGAIKGEEGRCLEAGMDDFLTKPLNRNMLYKILGKHLSSFNQQSGKLKKKERQNIDNLHFDPIMLMESIENNRMILEELIEIVPFQFAKDLTHLRRAIDEQDFAGIQIAAYSIKGSALNMWFTRMAELAKEIDSNSDNDHLTELEKIYEEMVLEWEQLKVLLKKMK